MRKPTRVISFVLSAVLMVTLAVVAVAADKNTSLDDLRGYVVEMEVETENN